MTLHFSNQGHYKAMKLSTALIAGVALAGAVSVANSASALATVFENYNYSTGDYAELYVTNGDAFAYSDVTIGGVDFGSLAAGASTTTYYAGDPGETSPSNVTVTVNSASGTFYVPDYDFTTSGQAIGTLSATTVPEPATWALMLVGFGGLGVTLRSRRKAAAATA